MTWEQFADRRRDEGFGSEEEIADYVAELQDHSPDVQAALLSER